MVVAGCLKLAGWQFDRAADKQALLDAQALAPIVQLDDVDGQSRRFSKLTGTGRFDPNRQILLDNQVRLGHAGVHVFTPFERHGDGQLFLVNRGWWPLADRTRLPEPGLGVPVETEILGILNQPPQVGRRIGRAGPLDPDNWPNLILYYDHARLAEVFGDALSPWIILLDSDHPAHTSHDPWQLMSFGPERHRGYAHTWIAIAITVVTLWIVLGWRAIRRKEIVRPSRPGS